jgi:mRNA interferase MazF
MKRGESWTGGRWRGLYREIAACRDSSGWPLDATGSVTICAFKTDPTDALLIRALIEPNEVNGLDAPSRIMVDKITTVRRLRLATRIGQLDNEDVIRLNRSVPVLFGLAGSTGLSRARRSASKQVFKLAAPD